MTTSKKLLLRVDSPSFSGGLLDELCQRQSIGITDVTVLTSAADIKRQQVAGCAFDAVVSVSSESQTHTVPLIVGLLALAKPGASVTIQEPEASNALQSLQQLALLSGLTQGADVKAYTLGQIPAADGQIATAAAVEGRKPAWEAGAQQPIKRKLGSKKQDAAVSVPVTQLWSAIDADDAELLDDEELLTEEDRIRPAAPAMDDCGVSRKACKNCTCGRAEKEAAGEPAQKLTQEMLNNPGAAGGCGSCALGDAFRCASCPYRGLPSFEMGKKIELPTGFLAEDL